MGDAKRKQLAAAEKHAKDAEVLIPLAGLAMLGLIMRDEAISDAACARKAVLFARSLQEAIAEEVERSKP